MSVWDMFSDFQVHWCFMVLWFYSLVDILPATHVWSNWTELKMQHHKLKSIEGGHSQKNIKCDYNWTFKSTTDATATASLTVYTGHSRTSSSFIIITGNYKNESPNK